MHAELYGIYVLAAVFGIYTLATIAEHYWQYASRVTTEAMEYEDSITDIEPQPTPFSELLRKQYEETKKERIVL